MKDRELVREDLLTIAYIIFVFKPYQNLHRSISKLLQKRILTFMGSDAIRSHPGQLLHE